MLEAHDEISKLPRLMDDTLERVVAPLMVWSDSTQLANSVLLRCGHSISTWKSIQIHAWKAYRQRMPPSGVPYLQ